MFSDAMKQYDNKIWDLYKTDPICFRYDTCLLVKIYIIRLPNYLEFVKYFVENAEVPISKTFQKICLDKMTLSEFEFINVNVYKFPQQALDYLAFHNQIEKFKFLYNIGYKPMLIQNYTPLLCSPEILEIVK